MILALAALVWLAVLVVVSIAPRLAHEARRAAQAEVLVLGLLGILTAGFYWQLLFTPNIYMPAGGGDLAGFLYPTYHFAQEWLTRGILPLWNPYIFGGTPFIGDIQTALFYPPNLITYWLSNPLQYRDLEYLAVLHVYLAGAGMYAFLRYGMPKTDGQPLNRIACLGGALAFQFSDVFVTHFGNLNLIASASWLPLILLMFTRALDTAPSQGLASFRSAQRAIRYCLLAAILLAISFFAGHIQPFLFILLTLALYTGYVILIERARWKRAAVLLALTLGVGAGLSAITLLPALELSNLSVRSAFTYQDAAQFSLPPLELIGLVIPGFFGRGAQDAWGPWSRVEVGYLGILPLLFAFFALVLRRNIRTLFFLALVLVGLLLALGGYAILHGWLFQFVPGFGQLRAPARFVLLMDFGLAVLCAVGFDALISPLPDPARRSFQNLVRRGAWVSLLVALIAGALALGILILGQGQDPALFQRIANAANSIAFFILLLAFSFALLFALTRNFLPSRVWSLLAVALIVLDLFSLGAYVDIGNSDPTLGYQRSDIIDFLRANTGLARIDSRTDVEGLWRPDTGLLFRLQDVNGDNPLVLNAWDTYWEATGGRDSVGYQLLNVKYALTRRGTPMPSNFVQAFQGGGGITVWENQTTAPRVWLATDAQVVGSEIQVPAVPSPPKQVTVSSYTPNEIVADLDADQNGYLIFSEVLVPGWVALVDDQPVSVVRANHLLRAVPITSGTHRVRLFYDPLSFKLGGITSALTLLLVLVGFGALAVRARK